MRQTMVALKNNSLIGYLSPSVYGKSDVEIVERELSRLLEKELEYTLNRNSRIAKARAYEKIMNVSMVLDALADDFGIVIENDKVTVVPIEQKIEMLRKSIDDIVIKAATEKIDNNKKYNLFGGISESSLRYLELELLQLTMSTEYRLWSSLYKDVFDAIFISEVKIVKVKRKTYQVTIYFMYGISKKAEKKEWGKYRRKEIVFNYIN